MGILDGLAGHRAYLDANFFIYLAEDFVPVSAAVSGWRWWLAHQCPGPITLVARATSATLRPPHRLQPLPHQCSRIRPALGTDGLLSR